MGSRCNILFVIIVIFHSGWLQSCKKSIVEPPEILRLPTAKILSANAVSLTSCEVILEIDPGNNEKVDSASLIFADMTEFSGSDIVKKIDLNGNEKLTDTLVFNLNRLGHDFQVKIKLKSSQSIYFSEAKEIIFSKCNFHVHLIKDKIYNDPTNGIAFFHDKSKNQIPIIIDFTTMFVEKSIEVKLNDSISVENTISFKEYFFNTDGYYETYGDAVIPASLPAGIYDVTVIIDSVKFKADSKFEILAGEWTTINNSFPGPEHREFANFVIGDNLFLISGDPLWQELIPKVWQCNLTTGIWYSKNNFPVPANQWRHIYGRTLQHSGTGYLFARNAFNNDSTDLWRYDLNQDTWSIVTTYPGKGKDIIYFIVADNLYAGCGRRRIDADNYEYDDFWTYNIILNKWTQLSNAPQKFTFHLSSACSAEQKAFLFSDQQILWEYEPLADKWTQKSLFMGPDRSKTSLVYLNNKIYMLGGEYINVDT